MMNFKSGNQSFKGILFGTGAYVLWGFLPVYWKLLQQVPPLEVLAHRIVWSLVFLLTLLMVTGRFPAFLQEVKSLIQQPRKLLGIFLAAMVLNFNWGTYIWAVSSNQIIQTSLGYYINPLISVLLGILFLKEKLSLWQLVAFILAFIGVLSLTIQYGTFPWVALSLALSFGVYGLLKKLVNTGSITGLTLETMLTSILAFTYLAYISNMGSSTFHPAFHSTNLLLMGAGVVTATPLILFAAGARRLPLFAIGFLQYISPTLSLLLGVFVYHEPFTRSHLRAFGIIWAGLLIFSLARSPIMIQAENHLRKKVEVQLSHSRQ